MKLEKYISDLLYRYDLVIVPGFGGIIGRKKPAHFNEDTYVFSPPHKELSFNAQLQNNDGLLADYVANLEGVSYDEANQMIASCVADWKKVLKNNKRLKLEQIGIFNWVDDGKFIFMPLTTRNYLSDAYGLTSFIHRPARKKETKEIKREALPVQKVQAVKKPLPQTLKTHRPASSNRIWKYAAVVLLGLGLFGGGLAVMQTSNQPVETYQKATFVLQKDFPAIQLGEQSKNALVESGEKQSASQPDKYFIISGAFRSKNNATKKVNDLEKQGFDAKILGKNKRGLWMVAYEGFATKTDAEQQLKEIKSLQKSAWIFTKE